MPKRIRLATARDEGALASLVAAFRDHLGEVRPDAAAIATGLARLLADPDTDFLLAQDGDGAPVGYAQLRYRRSLWAAGVEATLDDCFVAAAARGRGVGAQLVGACLDRARARGATLVGVATNERNRDALRLYERAGFRAERARWSGGRQLWLEREL